jgi:protein deglycase
MPRVAVLLAPGFEEIEAVTIIDVLRRADVDVKCVGVDADQVVGSHQIAIAADVRLDALDVESLDALVLPGGIPGALHLRDHPGVQSHIQACAERGLLVAAICAGPIALEAAGVLVGKRATSYPGFELPSAEYNEARVVEHGQVVTSRGPGTALEFSLALVARLVSPEAADALRVGMLID